MRKLTHDGTDNWLGWVSKPFWLVIITIVSLQLLSLCMIWNCISWICIFFCKNNDDEHVDGWIHTQNLLCMYKFFWVSHGQSYGQKCYLKPPFQMFCIIIIISTDHKGKEWMVHNHLYQRLLQLSWPWIGKDKWQAGLGLFIFLLTKWWCCNWKRCSIMKCFSWSCQV